MQDSVHLPADWSAVDLAGAISLQLRQWPLSALRVVHVELGMQCNVRCAMCFQTDFRPSSILPEAVWKEMLRPAYAVARQLTLIGGEPTVLSNCRALLELVLRDYPHLELVTATNGILFHGLWEEAFLKQGSCVNFSLNSIRPATYQKIVQFGQFDKAVANIDRLVRRKRETGSRLTLRISAVASDYVVDELPDLVQWGVDHGLDQVTLDPDYTGQLTRYSPSYVQTQIEAAYDVADRNPQIKLLRLPEVDRRYAMRYGLSPVRPHPFSLHEQIPCTSGFDTIHISIDGRVRPCCPTWYCYGNLLHNSLLEVWQSQSAFRFRSRMLRLDFRDCWTGCDRNACPLSIALSRLRQGWAALLRDPVTATVKVARTIGLATPQVKLHRRNTV
jgi:MoaA/NifB/PqqE/SkfB family radical SAM enzyme